MDVLQKMGNIRPTGMLPVGLMMTPLKTGGG